MNNKHWAVFLSNNSDTQFFAQQILNGKAVEPFAAFNHLKGVLFSPILLNELIEEESRRDYSEVTKNIRRQLKSLSSGEQKKALLAYVLAQQPDYIILDNPFDNLDKASQQSFKQMLTEIAEHTLLIQLINRKSDLLPFINNAIELEENNKIVLVDDIENYLDQHKKDNTINISQKVPPPIQKYFIDNRPLVDFKNVTVQYDEKIILKNINWTINTNEFWQLVGPNGSGKTTLLTMITGDNVKGYGKDFELFGKRKGSGETVWEIKKKIGYVTPAMTDLFSTRHTLQEMIVSGFYDSIGLYIIPTEMELRLANEWLQLIEMQHLKNIAFCELSLGLQRKALIARAMVKHPPLLILDEPAFGLDDHNTAMVTTLINKIAEESSTTILYVSHRSEDGIKPQFIFELIPTESGSIAVIK
ncbi:putative ABC transporter ATP-binding protein YlmA [mine drainage metagenome]|uniref:Putative ABC transporter ATP-binding protein YlmA n=1 Tax=mine drainage metagenome TaxID=410659 RepID=A0A1J5S101_9ZZZZ